MKPGIACAVAIGLSAACAPAAEMASERPLLTVGVVSDVHAEPHSRSEKDFAKVLRHFDAIKVDAVFSTGDVVNYGFYDWFARIGEIWFSVFPGNRRSDGAPVEPCFIYGDHETESMFNPNITRRLGEKHVAAHDIPIHGEDKTFEAAFHEKWAPIQKKTVKGFDVILAHHTFTSDWKKEHRSKDCWEGQNIPHLEEFLAQTPLDGAKPFFFLMHRAPKGTVIWPEYYRQNDGSTRRALRPHPNCVLFCGHYHHDARYERSLWQDDFTVVSCPSLWEVETQRGHENTRCCGTPVPMRQMAPLGRAETGQFLVLRVHPKRLVLERRSVLDFEKVAADWVVPWPPKGEAAYAARAAQAAGVEFAPGAKVTLSKPFVGKDISGMAREQMKVSFPTAATADGAVRAYDYRVTVESERYGVERILREKLVFSPSAVRSARRDTNDVFCVFCQADIPNSVERVRFKVTPRNGFGREGRPIYSTWQGVSLREKLDPAP